jgi:hypothetical protein
MPATGATSKSSPPRGTEHLLGKAHDAVVVPMSRVRTLAREAEFWLASERDHAERARRLGEGAQPLAAVEER